MSTELLSINSILHEPNLANFLRNRTFIILPTEIVLKLILQYYSGGTIGVEPMTFACRARQQRSSQAEANAPEKLNTVESRADLNC